MGIVSSIAFVLRQIYGPHPLVNMKLFLVPRFSAAAVISFFAGCAFLSSTFMIPLFVQEIQHYTPLRAGMLMIPGPIIINIVPLIRSPDRHVTNKLPHLFWSVFLWYGVCFDVSGRRKHTFLDFRVLHDTHSGRNGFHKARYEYRSLACPAK